MPTRAEIQLIRSLADKRARDEHRLFVAEGAKLVDEILASELRVRQLFTVSEDFARRFRATEIVSPREMERLSLLKTPSEVVALVEIPQRPEFDPDAAQTELVLALDGVQDPGNLGTIVRLADWFGIRNIACSPGSADCYNPKVVQATMGAIIRVAVHYAPLAEWLGGCRAPVYGTFLEGDNIYKCGLAPAGVVVMGSEGRGISSDLERLVTHKLYIPPYGDSLSESLNVASATAIVCSEFRRRDYSR